MIARLDGVVASKSAGQVVLDVGGVGYEVHVPLSTFVELPDPGAALSLCIHTYVREEALVLYGFRSEVERIAFRLLISISGVGPRIALAILAGIPLSRLVAAIRDGDVAVLRGIPGVGRKTADRIVIELSDKLDRLAVDADSAPADAVEDETISALENLGYPRQQAEKWVRAALESLPPGPPIEDLIREALRVTAR